MTMGIRVFMAKLRGLFGQRRTIGELEGEIQLHIQMLTERFAEHGMAPGDAEAAARRGRPASWG